MRIFIDTNIYLHAIDHAQDPLKGEDCLKIFESIHQGKISGVYNALIVSELHFNLNNHYKLLPKHIHAYLEAYFLKSGSFESRHFQIPLTLQMMKTCSLDFPDALIAQNALAEDIPILSYDKDFDRVPGVKRLEPKAALKLLKKLKK